MSNSKETDLIDWQELLAEFEIFDPGTEFVQTDPDVFVRSLIEPSPRICGYFSAEKVKKRGQPPVGREGFVSVPAGKTLQSAC